MYEIDLDRITSIISTIKENINFIEEENITSKEDFIKSKKTY